jgi:3-deoxy-D-manno-octulosonate 8-phosphate phosphatase KdsC-like HAD superfamily phosphatase
VAVTVPHAPAAVRLAADVVLRAAGGAGAVRELAERLVLAVGRPDLLGEGGA